MRSTGIRALALGTALSLAAASSASAQIGGGLAGGVTGGLAGSLGGPLGAATLGATASGASQLDLGGRSALVASAIADSRDQARSAALGTVATVQASGTAAAKRADEAKAQAKEQRNGTEQRARQPKIEAGVQTSTAVEARSPGAAPRGESRGE